jgi:hypothetical protein
MMAASRWLRYPRILSMRCGVLSLSIFGALFG